MLERNHTEEDIEEVDTKDEAKPSRPEFQQIHLAIDQEEEAAIEEEEEAEPRQQRKHPAIHHEEQSDQEHTRADRINPTEVTTRSTVTSHQRRFRRNQKKRKLTSLISFSPKQRPLWQRLRHNGNGAMTMDRGTTMTQP